MRSQTPVCCGINGLSLHVSTPKGLFRCRPSELSLYPIYLDPQSVVCSPRTGKALPHW